MLSGLFFVLFFLFAFCFEPSYKRPNSRNVSETILNFSVVLRTGTSGVCGVAYQTEKCVVLMVVKYTSYLYQSKELSWI